MSLQTIAHMKDAGAREAVDTVITRKLYSVDWDFADSARKTGVHGIHPAHGTINKERVIVFALERA